MNCFLARRQRGAVALAILTWLTSASAAPPGPSAITAPQTIDVQSIGPKIGERVPDFTLPDQQGRPVTLRSAIGPKGAMLVFFRSADW